MMMEVAQVIGTHGASTSLNNDNGSLPSAPPPSSSKPDSTKRRRIQTQKVDDFDLNRELEVIHPFIHPYPSLIPPYVPLPLLLSASFHLFFHPAHRV
jgi:hypothetical protein